MDWPNGGDNEKHTSLLQSYFLFEQLGNPQIEAPISNLTVSIIQ
jgi:hypothetical protein